MSNLTERQMRAFQEELQKEASKWYAGAARSVGRFAQRQAHSVTGWTPQGFMHPAGIEAMGAGAAPARAALAAAAKTGKGRRLAEQALAANEHAQALGLTSLPGYARALADPATRGRVLPAALRQQLQGSGAVGRAVTVGLPALGVASELASDDDPQAPTKGRRLGASIASTAAGLATGSLPFAGGALVGAGAGALGGAIGGGVDRFRKRRLEKAPHLQAPPNPEDSRGNPGPPVERNMSPAAAGQAPDFGG